jgi:hypothetical protein
MEVVLPPLIPVETLTRFSLGVHRSVADLSLEVSEALGISLMEVREQYFRDEEYMVDHNILKESDRLWEELSYREQREVEDMEMCHTEHWFY